MMYRLKNFPALKMTNSVPYKNIQCFLQEVKKRRKSHNSLCNSIMMSSNFTRGRTSVQTNIDTKKIYNQQLLLDGIHQLHLIRSTNTKIVVKATSK